MTTWNNALNTRNPIYKLYDYKKNNGTIAKLSVSNLKLCIESNGTIGPITGTLSSNEVKMITYKDRNINDVVLLVDGGKLKVYNGTNVSEVTPHVLTDGTGGKPDERIEPGLNDLANLTNCRAIALKKDRIFMVGHPTIKNRVHFSWIDPLIGFAVYDYFPAIYFFDVAVEDNDEIVDLKVFRNMLIIFCKKSIWALKGDGSSIYDLELIKLNVPDGCISANSIQVVGNNLFYLGTNHVYSLYATDQEFVSSMIMSEKVTPILKSVGLVDKGKANSITYDNKYYVSFPSGMVLVYDVLLECWTKYTNIKANSWLVRDEILYFSSNEGQIYCFNENLYSDNGYPINFMMKTKIINLGTPVNKKKFRRMWVLSKQWDNANSTFDLRIILDQNELENIEDVRGLIESGDAGVWDTGIWDESSWDFSETVQNEIKIRKKAKDIQFQIMNDTVDEPVSIFGTVIEYQLKKP